MRRLALLLPLLALGACVSPGPVGPTGSAPVVVRTKVDLTIAQAAGLLSENCTLLEAGLGVGELFASNAKARAAIGKAQLAIGSYCAGPPPADIPTALQAVAAAYRAVLAAQALPAP